MFAEFGTIDIGVLFVGAAVFAGTLVGLGLLSDKRRIDVRIRSVASGNRGAEGLAGDQIHAGRSTLLVLIRGLVDRLRLLPRRHAEGVARRLAQAGWRSRDAVVVYAFARFALPLASTGAAAGLIYGAGWPAMPPAGGLIASAVAGLIGYAMPVVIVRNTAERRRSAMRKALPDVLDLMVICTEAGLSIDATFARVAREVREASTDMADELDMVVSDLRYRTDRAEALDNWRRRVPLPQVRALCSTLTQTEKFGTPLAQAMRVLAAELRDVRMLKAEEKAARLPAIMTIPLILFILPALFVVVLGPAALDILDSIVRW